MVWNCWHKVRYCTKDRIYWSKIYRVNKHKCGNFSSVMLKHYGLQISSANRMYFELAITNNGVYWFFFSRNSILIDLTYLILWSLFMVCSILSSSPHFWKMELIFFFWLLISSLGHLCFSLITPPPFPSAFPFKSSLAVSAFKISKDHHHYIVYSQMILSHYWKENLRTAAHSQIQQWEHLLTRGWWQRDRTHCFQSECLC